MPVTITATRTTSLFTDQDGDGRVDLGDTLFIRLDIASSGDTDALNVAINDALVGQTGVTLAFDSEPAAGAGNDTNNSLDFGFLAANVAPVFAAAGTTITRVSTDSAGAQATGSSIRPVFSPDGSKVAFESAASNLVAGDSNGRRDIFVKDLATGTITRVSTDSVGAQALGNSDAPVFSPDGSKVAFYSDASNLVAGDTNGQPDIFVKDLATGAVTRISTTSAGAEAMGGSLGPIFSPDGSKVAFGSSASNLVAGDTNNDLDIFVKDLVTGAITRVSTDSAGAQAFGTSSEPIFSPDGSKIAFESTASNLVAGDTNGQTDVFVKDLATGAVTRISTDSAGAQALGGDGRGPVFSPDGSKVAFYSYASNLVAGDTNGLPDIFVKDLATGAITRVSTTSAGAQATGGSIGPVFSPDGSKLAFTSDASNLVAGDTNAEHDIFVKELGAPTPEFIENGAPVAVAAPVNVSDSDSVNYAGGTFSASLNAGQVVAGDVLSLASSGGASGINVAGTSVQYNGVEIGILTASATSLSVALDADATDAAVKALAEAVRFSSSSDDPTAAPRTVTFTLVDGGGTSGGGADTASFTRTVNVTPVDDPRTAVPDSGSVSDTATVVLWVVANDIDPDGGPLASVARVNGTPIAIGGSVDLASGARVTRNSDDGSLIYNTNGVFEALAAPGSGAANISASDSFTYTLAGGSTATVSMTINGIDNNDTLFGTAGDDTLVGGAGNDILYDGSGVDSLSGGTGNDTYVVDRAADSVSELADQGNDLVFASASYALAAGQEIETLSTQVHAGTGSIDLTGNAFANTLFGNFGSNVLDGQGGADTMLGLNGNDTYRVDDAGDVVIENAGGGNDAITTSVSYALAGNQEVETLSTADQAGTAAIGLIGNGFAQTLAGNAGANYLNGNSGSDTMIGLAGDDTYVVDDVGDVVTEAASGGADLVFTRISYTLPAGQEIETLSTAFHAGTQAIDLTGNEFANLLIGNYGANVLDGKGGNDTLQGLNGADSFAFTTVLGSGNIDTIIDFSVVDDTMLLDDAVFAGLATGGLASGAFVVGSAAGDADDRIIYDSATGALYFDADGNGSGAAVQFATLSTGLALTAGDFSAI